MKKRSLILLTVLLIASLLLTACTALFPAEMPVENEGEEEAVSDPNLLRIAELEAELQKTKEENYIKESQLSQEIEKLKERIDILTSKDEVPEAAPGSSSMIFHYTIENGGATITGYEGSCTLVQIPATLDGYPVRKIGERAFEGNTALAAVVVPDGVLMIDWFAFYNCSALLDITVPSSVSEIGHAVFDGCDNVTVVCAAGSYAESYAKSYGISYLNK